MRGGAGEGCRKHCFVNFCSLTLLYLSVGEGLGSGWGRKSRIFSQKGFKPTQ